MDHELAVRLIDAYIDAELDIGAAVTFAQHVAGCAQCANRLLHRSRLVQHVRLVAVCQAPEELRKRLRRQLGMLAGG